MDGADAPGRRRGGRDRSRRARGRKHQGPSGCASRAGGQPVRAESSRRRSDRRGPAARSARRSSGRRAEVLTASTSSPTVSRPADDTRQPDIDPRAEVDRALPGRALLARLPRLRAGVPAGHDQRAVHRRRATRRAQAGLPRRPRRLALRTSGRYNKGRGVVLYRPLPGHARASSADRVRRSTPSRGSRKRLISAMLLGGDVVGQDRQRPRGRLPEHPRLPLGRAVRLRDRALDFRRDAARRVARFGRRRSRPSREVLCTNPTDLAGGAARGDADHPTVGFARTRWRGGDAGGRLHRAASLHAVGLVPQRLQGALLLGGRRQRP